MAHDPVGDARQHGVNRGWLARPVVFGFIAVLSFELVTALTRSPVLGGIALLGGFALPLLSGEDGTTVARAVATCAMAFAGIVAVGAGLSFDGPVWLAVLLVWATALAALRWQWRSRPLRIVAVPAACWTIMIVVLSLADSGA